jgi:hypothetical protein
MLSFLSRHRVLFGLFLALSLAAGEFWLYAANRLGGFLHEKTFGGASLADFCESSEVAGFPFRLRLNCVNFSAPARIGDVEVIVKADEAHGVASVFAPNHIVLSLSSPMTVKRTDGGDFAKLRHDGLTLDLAWTKEGLDKATLDATALDWRPDAIEAGIAFNVQKLNIQTETVASANGGALHFNIAGDGLTAPAVQALLKTSDLGHVKASGQIAPAPTLVQDWRASVEAWRKNSGALGIEKFEWQAGDLDLSFNGALVLDDSHRPAGRLDVTAKGAGNLMAQFGIPAGAAQAQTLVGALLGKPDAKAGSANTLALPLLLVKGQVFLGPLRVAAGVQPLY